ncbi:hypothetical protein CKAH01_01461 [Colletotrichum kahawae]|uniref:Myb/SANT-like domain-containing protein n=1 Tax=Colletotrichum kahawae TaxID=34407 RepID=A0AAD9Y7R2_COLKA|nr:hypothetical protein CKAH01_01461 [Colletotrichum kahawae]
MDRDFEYSDDDESPPGTQEMVLDEIQVAESSPPDSDDEGPPANEPLSLPTPGQSSPGQATQQSQIGKKIRWTPALRDRFLRLSLQYKPGGIIMKTTTLEKLMGTVLPILAAEFPRDPFSIKALVGKFRATCTLFRKVKALTRLSGVGYDDISGRITATQERWQNWHTIYPGHRWLEQHGLPGMESLLELIWPFEIATGENIAEAGGAIPRRPAAREGTTGQSVQASTTGAGAGLPLSQATTVSGTALPVAAQVPVVTSNRRGRKRTSQQWDPDEIQVVDGDVEVQLISENVVAIPPARKRKDSRMQAADRVSECMKQILLNKRCQRPAGSDDIQRAVDTCQTSLKEDLGSEGVISASNFFSTVTTKAVAFNSLREKDDKLLFLRSNGIGRINLGGRVISTPIE